MPIRRNQTGGGTLGQRTASAGGLTQTQARNASILLSKAGEKNAPAVCQIALICAALGESNLGDDPSTYTPNSAGYWGVLQGGSGTRGAANNWPNPHDTSGMAESFLLGGKGFQSGGAIALYKSGVTDPGEIATRVEASGQPGSYYGKFEAQARAIVTAFNGGKLPGVAGDSTTSSGGGGGSSGAPSSILDLLTSPVDAIGGWLASIALNLAKDSVIGLVDIVVIPFWHWNQRAVDNYQSSMFTDKTGESILWNGAFWGLGYWLLFTDPESGSLKAAPVRKSRIARHVRYAQSLPARKAIIKPKHVKEKTTKKPDPVLSSAAIKQVDTMFTDRPQTVKVTSSERIKQRGNISTTKLAEFAEQDRHIREETKRKQEAIRENSKPYAKH